MTAVLRAFDGEGGRGKVGGQRALVAETGNGLAGMRERIEGVRGRLRIDAGVQRGMRLEARVPLAANDDA